MVAGSAVRVREARLHELARRPRFCRVAGAPRRLRSAVKLTFQYGPQDVRVVSFNGSTEEWFCWRDNTTIGADFAVVTEAEMMLVAQSDATEWDEDEAPE